MALWRSAGSCIVQPITYKSCTAQLGIAFGGFLGSGGGGSVDKISLSCAQATDSSNTKKIKRRIEHGSNSNQLFHELCRNTRP